MRGDHLHASLGQLGVQFVGITGAVANETLKWFGNEGFGRAGSRPE
jgi:hypothetical protein